MSTVTNHIIERMSGENKKPEKKIDHIRTRKAHSGGYIHEHHHTHPDHHPMEQHVSPDQDGMVSHMLDHMGEANPGETAEATPPANPASPASPAEAQPTPVPGV